MGHCRNGGLMTCCCYADVAVCQSSVHHAPVLSTLAPVSVFLTAQGEARSDLHTLRTASRLDVIRGLFGPEVASSLLPLQSTGGSGGVSESVALDGPMGFVAEVRGRTSCGKSVWRPQSRQQCGCVVMLACAHVANTIALRCYDCVCMVLHEHSDQAGLVMLVGSRALSQYKTCVFCCLC